MTREQANEILGISEETSPEERRVRFRQLSEKFHPDVPLTGNASYYALTCTAYLYLIDNDFNFVSGKNIPSEIQDAIQLKARIELRVKLLSNQFLGEIQAIRKTTLDRIKFSIFSAGDHEDLRGKVNKEVSKILNETAVEIGMSVETLAKSISKSDSEYILDYFKRLHVKRQRMWLVDLYRHPIVISEVFGGIVMFLIHCMENVQKNVPFFSQLAPYWWIFIMIMAIGNIFLVFQYLELNPRQQFIPPRLTVGDLHDFLADEIKKIGTDRSEIVIGAAVFGALIGSMIFPGVGTAFGAALCSFIGAFFGADINESKNKIFIDISQNFNIAIEQITDRIKTWVSKIKQELLETATECFIMNYKKLATAVRRQPALIKAPSNLILNK